MSLMYMQKGLFEQARIISMCKNYKWELPFWGVTIVDLKGVYYYDKDTKTVKLRVRK